MKKIKKSEVGVAGQDRDILLHILISLNFYQKFGTYFFLLYIFNAQLVPCLLTRVIVTRVRGKIMHIFTLLACSDFGDPAVPDPPSVENRVSSTKY